MKIHKFLLIFIMSVYFKNIYTSNLPEPYKNIKILPLKTWDSWFINQKALLKLIKANNPKIIVELGSWLGASTSFIAKNTSRFSKIYAVDIWIETKQCAESIGFKRNELDVFFNNLYQQFLSNIIHLGVANKVIPVKMSTLEAAIKLNINPDLVYVDASHEAEAVYNDIKVWYQKLSLDGIMCGDDWCWPTVQEGVIKIAKELNQNINYYDNLWWFDPKS